MDNQRPGADRQPCPRPTVQPAWPMRIDPWRTGAGDGRRPGSRSTDEPASLDGVPPHTTALDFLRDRGLTGAKEGCAEGECGACSVMVARPGLGPPAPPSGSRSTPAWSPRRRSTARRSSRPRGSGRAATRLHPVQHEMAVRGGSQCGYCTPGFVCSMAAEYYRRRPAAANGDTADGRARRRTASTCTR